MHRRDFSTQAIAATFAILCASLCTDSAQAEVKLLSLAAGGTIPTVMGSNYLVYGRDPGASIEASAGWGELLGDDFAFYLSETYQPLGVIGQASMSLKQWQTLFGLETRQDKIAGWIRPFVSAGLGATYSNLTYTGVTNTTQNSNTVFALQVRSGFSVPVGGPISVQFSAPITVEFSKTKLVLLNSIFSLRWTL